MSSLHSCSSLPMYHTGLLLPFTSVWLLQQVKCVPEASLPCFKPPDCLDCPLITAAVKSSADHAAQLLMCHVCAAGTPS